MVLRFKWLLLPFLVTLKLCYNFSCLSFSHDSMVSRRWTKPFLAQVLCVKNLMTMIRIKITILIISFVIIMSMISSVWFLLFNCFLKRLLFLWVWGRQDNKQRPFHHHLSVSKNKVKLTWLQWPTSISSCFPTVSWQMTWDALYFLFSKQLQIKRQMVLNEREGDPYVLWVWDESIDWTRDKARQGNTGLDCTTIEWKRCIASISLSLTMSQCLFHFIWFLVSLV